MRTVSLLHVFDLVAELRIGLHDHLPGAAEAVEVVDVARAEIRLQRAEHIAQVHALRQARVAIDVDEQLRRVGLVDA